MNEQPLPLKDIHLPSEPGIWPLAPGWWVLIALALILIAILAVLLFKFTRLQLQKRKYKKQLKQRLVNEFIVIQENHLKLQDKHQLACDISAFLRRITLYELQAKQRVGLQNEDWLFQLNQLVGIDLTLHSSAINDAPYNPSIDFDDNALLTDIKRFYEQVIKIAKSNQEREQRHV